jgi:hypothetical protein
MERAEDLIAKVYERLPPREKLKRFAPKPPPEAPAAPPVETKKDEPKQTASAPAAAPTDDPPPELQPGESWHVFNRRIEAWQERQKSKKA